MTTATTAGRERHATTEDSGIPFGRLVRTELRKLTDTRASRWLLIAIVAATPIVVAVMLFAAAPKDLTYNKLVDYTQTPQKILLPALGILAMTSEWSQRTGLVTFTLVPDRRRVLLAKFTAVLALGLLVIAVAFAAAAIGNALGAALRHGNGSWSFGASGFGEITLLQLTGLVQGMAFGMALLVTAAAVTAYYVVPNLWSVLFGSIASLKPIAPWFDLNKAQSPLYTHDITGRGWLQLLVALAIWVAIPLALGVWRVSRTEVRSS
jgi:ABC-type transport system involved in multi-copper enzyme maturation permease subunit